MALRARHCAAALVVAAGLCGFGRPCKGQSAGTRQPSPSVGEATIAYRRVAELAGDLPAHQWSLRPFEAGDNGRGSATGRDPWGLDNEGRDTARLAFRWLPFVSQTIFNSALPAGNNDGALWAGRGLTVAAEGGFSARAGALSVTVYPTAFWAQNAPFELISNGQGGRLSYGDPTMLPTIDRPQRFGDQAYARVDPGQSTARLDIRALGVGGSTANRAWGPALESPLLLGNNAPGFPHLFAGTGRPVSVGIGVIQALAIWGKGSPSDYAVDRTTGRYIAAAVGTFSPRGTPDLELGAARFYHIASTAGLPRRFWLRAFDGILKTSLASGNNPGGDDPEDNQLASIFFRWAFPGEGFEFFGEYGREDHNWNVRDLAGQPDHDAGYLLGLQRVWRGEGKYTGVRAEVLNTRLSHLYQALPQAAWYTHSSQSHTERGQTLGAPGAVGGGTAMLSVFRYSSNGGTSVSIRREMQAEALGAQNNPVPSDARVRFEASVEQTRRSNGREVVWLAALANEYNRPGGATTFNARAAVRLTLARERAMGHH